MSSITKVACSSKRKKHTSGEDSGGKSKKTSVKLPEKPLSGERDIPSHSQKIFSKEDEIHLLNAFLNIKEIARVSPSPIESAVLLFKRIGDSLAGNFSRTQLIHKLRKLKHRYSNQVNNKSSIKSRHEQEIFKISHKIWSEDSNGSEKDPKSSVTLKDKENSKSLADTLPLAENGAKVVVPVELGLENFPVLMEEFSRFPGNEILRRGFQCLDESELRQLNEQWRLQRIAEAEVLAKRAKLIHEQTQLLLKAVISSP